MKTNYLPSKTQKAALLIAAALLGSAPAMADGMELAQGPNIFDDDIGYDTSIASAQPVQAMEAKVSIYESCYNDKLKPSDTYCAQGETLAQAKNRAKRTCLKVAGNCQFRGFLKINEI